MQGRCSTLIWCGERACRNGWRREACRDFAPTAPIAPPSPYAVPMGAAPTRSPMSPSPAMVLPPYATPPKSSSNLTAVAVVGVIIAILAMLIRAGSVLVILVASNMRANPVSTLMLQQSDVRIPCDRRANRAGHPESLASHCVDRDALQKTVGDEVRARLRDRSVHHHSLFSPAGRVDAVAHVQLQL